MTESSTAKPPESHEWSNLERVCAITIAVLAAALAIFSLEGGNATSGAQLAQIQAADSWSLYQARSIKGHTFELEAQSFGLLSPTAVDPEKQKAFVQHCTKEAEKYNKEKEDARKDAEGHEAEVKTLNRFGDRVGYGILMLQIAIVVVSTSILVKSRALYATGTLVGLVGMATSASAFLLSKT